MRAHRNIALAVATTAAVPATAHAITEQHAHAYERAYHAVVRKLGRRAPGRNIVNDGLAHGRLTDHRVLVSLAVLRRMLRPPPRVVVSRAVSSTEHTVAQATVQAAQSAAGAAGVPACASESGTNYSTGPDNTNASSGATGRYQIIPSTAAAYGCSLATPAGQDQCAQTIYRNQGAGAWVGCGG